MVSVSLSTYPSMMVQHTTVIKEPTLSTSMLSVMLIIDKCKIKWMSYHHLLLHTMYSFTLVDIWDAGWHSDNGVFTVPLSLKFNSKCKWLVSASQGLASARMPVTCRPCETREYGMYKLIHGMSKLCVRVKLWVRVKSQVQVKSRVWVEHTWVKCVYRGGACITLIIETCANPTW